MDEGGEEDCRGEKEGWEGDGGGENELGGWGSNRLSSDTNRRPTGKARLE